MELLTTEQAAGMLKLGRRTLDNWRCDKVGPPFVRVGGKVFYRPADLVAWVERHTVNFEAERASA